MAGHSKWAQIKRAKAANDAKRGQAFSKLAREITIATRIGQSGDPDMNPRLRMVLLKARAANMPKDNIERAIEKGSGGAEGAGFEDLVYEIFAPHGVGLLVEISTDNRNRTAGEIRNILSKAGGNLASSGAVSRFFERKGQIMIPRDAVDEETLMELALEAGAEDVRSEEEGYEILTDPAKFDDVQKAIEAKEIGYAAAAVTMLPIEGMAAPLTDPKQIQDVSRLVEKLDEHDDVNEVHLSVEFQGEEERAPGLRLSES